MLKADITIKQVDHFSRICHCGHIAPENFKSEEGEGPTKFFQVTGNGITGIYCELCLIIANFIKRKNKVI
jgi:hypothetical protein